MGVSGVGSEPKKRSEAVGWDCLLEAIIRVHWHLTSQAVRFLRHYPEA